MGATRSALPGVRGLVVGRTLLYPADGDVAAAVDTAAALVHGGSAPDAAKPTTACPTPRRNA